MRKCIVTGQTFPKECLIRFGISPDRTVVPDLACKLPGRGIWVSADKEAVVTAVRKGLFTKAARGRVSCPEDLDAVIASLFVKRLQSLLGFARKAGLVVSGFEKVVAALQKGQAAYLVEASDGAADGREKIDRLRHDVPVFDVLTGDEIAQALGAEICVHAALKAGGAAETFAAEARRFAAYCQKKNF